LPSSTFATPTDLEASMPCDRRRALAIRLLSDGVKGIFFWLH
jgi:hypothetical protein